MWLGKSHFEFLNIKVLRIIDVCLQKNGLFVGHTEVQANSQIYNVYVPMQIINELVPQKVIAYYESRIVPEKTKKLKSKSELLHGNISKWIEKGMITKVKSHDIFYSK